MSLLRAFIAIELSQIILETIERQTTRLRQTVGDDIIRWVPPQNMHLTLKFIGGIAASHLDFLKQMLTREASTHPQFDMQIGGLGSFPSSRMPRILWVGLHAPAVLTSLHKSIETGASRLGYEKEERAFSPHLTIGRARQNITPAELSKVRAALDTIQLGNIAIARVDSVHLFKSDLQSGGSIYTKLFSAPLSKS
ncbi:MAG: RNA 2',3'-cyclic phosphodiesterase [Anaerolineales bacterium]|uniref:RNA 2',3'-cyclic phosphodiesterase n=1 Tax=Candidatus Villigracilis proximus TaxID=3140683 RepID=UPI003134E061|nr:RNA 2',3'-cyclic phosphodiesterase [Anaerolineales bacterium]MBK8822199.1 RNA 2',3'-cyclic phosphodiesterase [Anaerolineales bacterium]MBK9210847.1 RNA 2',3'-cyclic phosphodiesterase [Anaerolineales bacterium]